MSVRKTRSEFFHGLDYMMGVVEDPRGTTGNGFSLQKLERPKCSSHDFLIPCLVYQFIFMCVSNVVGRQYLWTNTPCFGLFKANVERGRPLNEALNKSDLSERKPRPRLVSNTVGERAKLFYGFLLQRSLFTWWGK